MTCSICHKPAQDNAMAYYTVEVMAFVRDSSSGQLPSHHRTKLLNIVKCWTCLTPAEKAERDPGYSDRVRFELIKSLRTK